MPEYKNLESELKGFAAAFSALIPSNPALLRKASIYLAVQNRLRQSGLFQVDPFEIFSEAWLLGVQTIKRGNSIKKPDGWLYTVTLRIIAKKISQEKPPKYRLVPYDDTTEERPMSANEIDLEQPYREIDNAINPDYKKLREAMAQLGKHERELLEHSILDDWSYAEIAHFQGQQTPTAVDLATLRQKRSRAMKKLKSILQRLG